MMMMMRMMRRRRKDKGTHNDKKLIVLFVVDIKNFAFISMLTNFKIRIVKI